MDEELKQAIEAAKEQQPVTVDLQWYQSTIKLPEIKEFIRANINSASRSFVAIGYYLKYVRDNGLHIEDAYDSIWEFAKSEFGIGKSSASQFMNINDKFSVDGNSPILLEKYRDFASSKLSEMLTLSDEQLEQVTITTTRAKIREMKQPEKVESAPDETVLHAEQTGPKCFIRKDLEDGLMCSGGISDECNNCDRFDPVKSESEEPKLIDDLELSVRTYNCLKRANIDTVEKLCELTEIEVVEIRNISRKCIDEIKLNLSEIGRSLKLDDIPETVNDEPENVDIQTVSESGVDEVECFDKLAAYWCKREMTVELYELAKSQNDEDVDVFNRYFRERFVRECYAPSYDFPGHEISFKTDKDGIYFDDAEKTGYSWQLLIDLVCQEAENDTPASKPTNLHENDEGIKRLKEIRREFRGGEKVTESVETVIEKLDNGRLHRPDLRGMMQDPYCRVCGSSLEYKQDCKCGNQIDWSGLELVFEFEEEQLRLKAEQEVVEVVEADIIQTVPDVVVEEPELAQPELPILKNNDQRKDFIDAYVTWPIWIDTKETGERYYRYDLSDKAAMVVRVSLKHIWKNYKETDEIDYDHEEYYLLGVKTEYHSTGTITKEDDTRTFFECSSNKSALVDYLKDIQKKGGANE